MKHTRLIVLALAFMSAMPSIAHAQGASMELSQAGKYDRAVEAALKALEVAEQVGPDHLALARSLNKLAEIYKTQGDYAKAEPLYNRSLAIRERTLRYDHPDVAESLENCAALCRATDRNKEAEPLEQRAASIRAIKR